MDKLCKTPLASPPASDELPAAATGFRTARPPSPATPYPQALGGRAIRDVSGGRHRRPKRTPSLVCISLSRFLCEPRPAPTGVGWARGQPQTKSWLHQSHFVVRPPALAQRLPCACLKTGKMTLARFRAMPLFPKGSQCEVGCPRKQRVRTELRPTARSSRLSDIPPSALRDQDCSRAYRTLFGS